MKKKKKLPFYLQKFQFELWTLVFGIFGIFITNPVSAILADSLEAVRGSPSLRGIPFFTGILSLKGPEGLKTDVFGGVKSVAYRVYGEGMSDVEWKGRGYEFHSSDGGSSVKEGARYPIWNDPLRVNEHDPDEVKNVILPNRFNLRY